MTQLSEFLRASAGVIRSPKSDVAAVGFFLKSCFFHIRGKRIFSHQNAHISGLSKIATDERLYIGTPGIGFLVPSDRTFLNIRGHLHISGGPVTVGKGCRLDIGPQADCLLENCSIGGMSRLIIAHHLSIGSGSLIAWGCEFLDDDWHTLEYADQHKKAPGIKIGRKVWVGSQATLLKGVRIPNGCVVAARSVVTRSFDEENVLIAGHPARIIRRGIKWS